MKEVITYTNGEGDTYRTVISARTECIGEEHSLHGVEGWKDYKANRACLYWSEASRAAHLWIQKDQRDSNVFADARTGPLS